MKYTDEQILTALRDHDSRAKAQRALGMDRRAFARRLKSMQAASGEPLPGSTVYPVMSAGQRLYGVSSLQKVKLDNGETVMQWVKTERDRTVEDQNAALEALKSELPRHEPFGYRIAGPDADERLANLFVITDYHMGMYSWAEETGADWDMAIAEELLVQWFEKALRAAPEAALGILGQLGDFGHYDSLAAVTPTSHHQLDADSRAQKMVRVMIRVLRRVINMMLEKYPRVIVLMAEGNHDPMSSAWLREAFRAIYENEPRVEIRTSPDPYYAVQWGKVGLFFHHGHMKKPEAVDKVFARKFREIYGSSTKCYGHMGHMHHKLVVESALMHVEQHPTLAAADAYASRGGYMSDRAASVISYDREFGEVGRVSINPEMVRVGS